MTESRIDTRMMKPSSTARKVNEHRLKEPEYYLGQSGNTREQCTNESWIATETIAIASVICGVNINK